MNQQHEFNFDLQELSQYIAACCDGTADETTWKKIDGILLNNPDAQMFYLKHLHIHSRLSKVFRGEARGGQFNDSGELENLLIQSKLNLKESSEEMQPSVSTSLFSKIMNTGEHYINFRSYTAISCVVAALFIIATLGTLAILHEPLPEPMQLADAPEVRSPVVVAKLVETTDAIWEGNHSLFKGQSFFAGYRIQLLKGFVEFQFLDGAQVLLEGPCEFIFDTPTSGTLNSGKIAAYVPPRATGFAVHTQAAQIIDLSTEFGVQVLENADTLVQVKQGKVEVTPRLNGKPDSSRKCVLHAGESIRISLDLTTLALSKDTTTFVYPKVKQQDGFQQWKEYSEQLKKDPTLVAYYTFEKQLSSPRKLINSSLAHAGQFDGILGDGNQLGTEPSWESKHWPGKTVLRFRAQQTQRVEVKQWPKADIDREITIATWVKNENKRQKQTILTHHFDANTRSPSDIVFFHLSSEDSRIKIGLNSIIKGKSKWSNVKQIPLAKLLIQDNRWVHMAVTIKSNGGPILLYLDGQQVQEGNPVYKAPLFPKSQRPLVIGGRTGGGTSFDGCIGEIAIFNRVLSAKEIRKMYEIGKLSNSPD